MTTTMQIAQTIVSQIKSLDRNGLMAWVNVKLNWWIEEKKAA
jgi:hypothetical protein